MDTGSLIAVILANAVALAALGAGFLQQRKGLAHDQRMADREAVRDLLSETATVLHRLEYVLDEVRSTLTQWGTTFFESDERAKPYVALEEVGREADLLLGQLRIQLGPKHQATAMFDQAFSASLDIFRALGLIKMEDPAIKGTYAEQEVRDMVKDQRERITTSRVVFDDRADKFVALAHAAAGAQLPTD